MGHHHHHHHHHHSSGHIDDDDKHMLEMKKHRLPTKICVVCGLPFTWRKKWAKVWDEVKYCSERCRRSKNKKYPYDVPDYA
nr:hypothetical protein FTT0848 [synthetic construct]